MIKKTDLENIMNALMLRCWGIISIDNQYLRAVKNKRYFNVSNSILKHHYDDESTRMTVLAIAVPYQIEGTRKPENNYFGKVDAFSWNFDYHFVIKELLEKIKIQLEVLSDQIFSDVTLCVDNSPFNDREVGFYCGLGKVGYNHLLINDTLGSNFFIGYIVIRDRIEIEYEALMLPQNLPKTVLHPNCASCRRCLKACPTGVCDIENSNMDLCLSALTQTKNWIDDGQREKFTNRIYGCSTCQSVCPLNKGKEEYAFESLQLVTENWIDLIDMLSMNKKMFQEKFSHMGFAWRPFWVYKRNALIVLGNTGDETALIFLKQHQELLADEKLSDYYLWAVNKLENLYG